MSDVVATELDPCVGPIVFVCDLVSNAAGSAQAAASDYVLGGIASAFTNAAAHLGEMALRLLDSSTAVDLSADWLRANVGVVAAVTLPLVVGLFAAQVIGSVLRREGAGLARAVVGVGKALLGGALALGATQLALTAVDEMCEAVAGAAGTTVGAAASQFFNFLAGADVDIAGWVSVAEVSSVLRTAYDPTARTAPDHVPSAAAPPAMGIAESWTHVATDGGVHSTYWIAEWPRSDVHPGFLQPLVLSPDATRTVTVIAEPLPIASSLREIRRAKAEHAADSAQRARIGQVEDESIRAELDDLLRREQGLVAGHGDLRFTGLVTVTARSAEELDAACAATEAAAAQALCELRRLVGQQASAHLAATVPLARGVL